MTETDVKRILFKNALAVGVWFAVFMLIGILHLNPIVNIVLLVGLFFIGLNTWATFQLGKELGGMESARSRIT